MKSILFMLLQIMNNILNKSFIQTIALILFMKTEMIKKF